MALMASILSLVFALLLAPLLPGIILKVKALLTGKKGPPLLIRYYTLIKLCRKGSVYSTSTSFVFRLGPLISCATALMALCFFPFPGAAPLVSFPGDVIVVFYLLGLGRFFIIAAALDTASPFEGMGAAREAFFAALAEVALFVILILFFRTNGSFSLADCFGGTHPISLINPRDGVVVLVLVGLFMVLLTENSRVPVDDPATHLELTMIHEAMILDHSGPDLALIEFGAYVKLLFYASMLAGLLAPPLEFTGALAGVLLFYGLLVLVYIAIGITESITARLKMPMVPKYILTSFALVFFSIILSSMEMIP
ncbi:MAG: respiratory chain complex I subunit 1 family protein [Desulfobulbus sp.]|jgi:formate hydrogenlyase subunit 4